MFDFEVALRFLFLGAQIEGSVSGIQTFTNSIPFVILDVYSTSYEWYEYHINTYTD